MTAVDTINRAVLFLAGRCDGAHAQDGAGFNRWDAQWGHRAASFLEEGRAGLVNPTHALRVVSKYRKQLTKAGIELPALEAIAAERPAPPTSAAAPPGGAGLSNVLISRRAGLVHIAFPYSPELVAKARELPGRRWDPASKTWTAPSSALGAVFAAFPGAGLEPTLAAELEKERAAQAATDAARATELARALAVYEPLRTGLYDHQDAGVRWLIEHRTGILADDMGLGKTRQSLVAARALGFRTFVLAPAGLRLNWLREAEAVDWPIEVFSWAKVPEAFDGDYTLIADEAHYAQNLKAKRTSRFLDLARGARAVFALTGTPIKNGRPVNLFPLLVATRHPLGADKKAYELRYCNAGPTRWSRWDTTGAAHLEELHERISDGLLRRMKDECLDLPAKVRVLRKAELSDAAADTYARTLADLRAKYAEAKRARIAELQRQRDAGEIDPATCAAKLGTVDAGDALVLLNALRHAGSIAKTEAAGELAEEILEQGGQVVLFTAFLDSARTLAETLGAGLITGEQGAAERQAEIDAFQAGQRKALVCTLGAGNVGITLTAAQTVILVDRPWTPGDALQAEDRLHRIGQRGSVLAVWLQANGADEAIDALLLAKQEKIELVLHGKRRTLAIGSMADLAEAVLG